MITMISAFVSLLSFRFRSRAGLELELVALRHQVAILRRQRKGRIQLFSTDRLLWVWLYRISVAPATSPAARDDGPSLKRPEVPRPATTVGRANPLLPRFSPLLR